MLIRVTKIEPMSLAKTLCVLQGSIGLVLGLFLTIIAVASTEENPDNLFGVWSFIMFPLINAIVGMISGWLIAVLYNFLTKFVGGIELDMEQ